MLRILMIVDEFTRRRVEVEHRMNAELQARTLLRLFAIEGVPMFIGSDDGPEFSARSLMNVLNGRSGSGRIARRNQRVILPSDHEAVWSVAC